MKMINVNEGMKITELLNEACQEDTLTAINDGIKALKNDTKGSWKYFASVAIQNHRSDILQYMVENETSLKYPALDKEELFLEACIYGCLESVRYLIHSHGMTPQTRDNYPFVRACAHGNLPVVKYLLTSTEVAHLGFADIETSDGHALRWATKNGQMEIVKYLLSSPELSTHATMGKKNLAFKSACADNNRELVEYFIFDHAIKYNADLKKYCAQNHNLPICQDIPKMFMMRDLNEKLDVSSTKKRKMKL